MVKRGHGTLAVAIRLIVAILGGYAFAYVATAALTLSLPVRRDDAVQASAMLAFPIEVAATLWLLVDPRWRRPVLMLAGATSCLLPILVTRAP